MRFTKTQVALLISGISFVHMAPTPERAGKARDDLIAELHRNGWTYTYTPYSVTLNGIPDAWAKFMVCTAQGASTDHVAVMFMDGKKAEFKDQMAYDHARYIPANIDGHGPMVVR